MPKPRSGPSARIAAELRAAIADGRFPPGAKLPTVRDLMERYGVSRNTAAKAIAQLRDEGHVATRYGSGTYVQEARSHIISITATPETRISNRRATHTERRELELADDGWVTVVERGGEVRLYPADQVEVRGAEP